MDQNSGLRSSDICYIPVVCDEKIVCHVVFSEDENGKYISGGGEHHADALNELLSTGKEYAIVSQAEYEIIYAVSEDNQVTTIYKPSHSDTAEPESYLTFSEAKGYGNVISLEKMLTKTE